MARKTTRRGARSALLFIREAAKAALDRVEGPEIVSAGQLAGVLVRIERLALEALYPEDDPPGRGGPPRAA